jgi:predicted  nucleic acid-binding Zn-ribbon protein
VTDSGGVMRCLRCKTLLERSGKEPHRLICPKCGQHYFLQMQLVPVAAPDRLLEGGGAERGSRAE